MTANAHRGTAKVIQFPKGGRASLSDNRYGANASQRLPSVQLDYVEFGAGSYHEAAIRAADRYHDH